MYSNFIYGDKSIHLKTVYKLNSLRFITGYDTKKIFGFFISYNLFSHIRRGVSKNIKNSKHKIYILTN